MIIALAIISWWLLTLLPAVLLFTERGRRWTRAVVMMLCVTSLTGLSGLSGLSGETFGPQNPIVFNPSLWLSASASSPQTDGALGLASASSQYASLASVWWTTYPCSFCAWVNTASSGGNQFIFSENLASSSGQVYCNINSSLKVAVSFGNSQITSNTAVTSGVFTSVIVTYDGTTCNIYINGTKDANSGALANNFGAVVATTVGASGGHGSFFNGQLTLSLFNTTLTAGQIATLVAGVLPTAYAANGIPSGVSAYQFTQPAALGVDSIGSNTLTLVNTPTAAAGPVLGPCTVAGESIAQFTRSDGNGTITYQGTVANRFLYEPNAINGQAAFQSPGTGAFYSPSASIVHGGTFTLYAVGKRSNATGFVPFNSSGNAIIQINGSNNVVAVNDANTSVTASYTGSTGSIATRWRRDASNVIWFAATGMAEVSLGTCSGNITLNRLFGSNTNSGDQFADVFDSQSDMVTNGQYLQEEAWIKAKYGVTIP